jgi:hypothetical protein
VVVVVVVMAVVLSSDIPHQSPFSIPQEPVASVETTAVFGSEQHGYPSSANLEEHVGVGVVIVISLSM